MKTENLDAVATEYRPDAATAIENDLILNWYPERIIRRFGSVDSILELGIGHGFTPGLFNAACERHVIIEGSQFVIDQFKAKSPDFTGEVVFSYFEDFETEERFDVIIMGFILEHVDDPGMLLERFKKFLKPGGRIFVAVPNAKSMNRRLGVELGKIDDIYSLNANDHAFGHKRQYCRDTLKHEMQSHGYSVSLEEGIYLKPLPLGVLKTLPDFQENLDAMLRVGIDFPDLCVALLMEARLQ
ncbi:class I SAM-dependent methyltransferase [Pararhizobium sp. YC-54]|uniref:class I SAM-dependent methyltransferase n=1 Tax=Pararhizobium sp. YC-54 TaxID=2986920 RepID=UPI0021F720A7|nr:class I SAM-dependent methyltransferase [Pararhizobium sp. YC-54]MCV9998883.1 class I SAM-dependent methyltransferase [Pararhizobium sp. YC-54]